MAASREGKFWRSKYQMNFLVCSVGRMQKMRVAYKSKKSRKQQKPILEIRDLYKALAKPMHHFSDTRIVKRDSSQTPGSPVTFWPIYSPPTQVSQFAGVSDLDLANDLIWVWQQSRCSCQWPPPSPWAKNEHPILAVRSFIKCPRYRGNVDDLLADFHGKKKCFHLAALSCLRNSNGESG